MKLKDIWYSDISTINKEGKIKKYEDTHDSRISAIRSLVVFKEKKNEKIVIMQVYQETGLDL